MTDPTKETDMTLNLTPSSQISSPVTPSAVAAPDTAAIKARQQVTWGSGDYAVVGTTLQIVGETLCEAVDLRPAERVLDVATGNGNAALAAARRYAEVTGVDYVPTLLARGRVRADADHLPIQFREGDAEALPFPDRSFDVVLSTFGVMFAPDQEQAARELVRSRARAGALAWRTGPPRASSAPCSAPSASTCRRPPA